MISQDLSLSLPLFAHWIGEREQEKENLADGGPMKGQFLLDSGDRSRRREKRRRPEPGRRGRAEGGACERTVSERNRKFSRLIKGPSSVPDPGSRHSFPLFTRPSSPDLSCCSSHSALGTRHSAPQSQSQSWRSSVLFYCSPLSLFSLHSPLLASSPLALVPLSLSFLPSFSRSCCAFNDNSLPFPLKSGISNCVRGKVMKKATARATSFSGRKTENERS